MNRKSFRLSKNVTKLPGYHTKFALIEKYFLLLFEVKLFPYVEMLR